MSVTKGWQSLSYQWTKDFQLFLFVLASLTVFRILLLLIFGEQVSNSSTTIDYASVFWMGFRVDMGTSAAWVAITFLLSLSCAVFYTHQKLINIRLYSAQIFVVVSVFVLGIDLVFFKVYGDHYNQMLLGLIYDDAGAILLTIWKEHNPILYLSAFIVSIFFLRKLVVYWLAYDLAIVNDFCFVSGKAKKIGLGVFCVFLVVFAMRGGTVSGAPLQIRHIFVTNDGFLNRAIINPFFALRQTIKNQLALNSKNGLSVYWNPDNLPDALNLISTSGNDTSKELAIDNAIIKTAPGFTSEKPRHVFLILMESYSGWTLLPAYKDIGLSTGLTPFAEQGIHFPNFLSATRATVDSLSVLVSGLPYAGLNINHESGALTQFPTSVAKIFNDLGYKTRFIYGGYIGWQRLDTFIDAQGFDEVYSAADIKTPTTGNEWGVDDEYMFKYAEDIIDDETPSFNFILSTSSHSPYDLDLEKLGYPLKNFPAKVVKIQDNAVEVMGHHWYADRELGTFLNIMKNKLDTPVFSITGDHSARVALKFPQGTSREGAIVPLVLYGPEVLKGKVVDESVAGSHQDIIPTLVNIAAPKGFKYPAFGKDMLSKDKTDVGVGLTQMIGSNFISKLDQSIEPEVFMNNEPTLTAPNLATEPTLNPVLNKEQQAKALDEINATRGISWFRLRRGNNLPYESIDE